jgi:hypothetical protein
MKYYCITPATKDKPGVCVLPIMQEPTDFWPGFNETDTDVLNHYEEKKNIWENHLASLPKFPTSCDRVGWFEASEKWHVHTSSYQGESDHYFDTEAEADNKYWEWATWNGNLQAHTDKPRKVIVPVEQKLPDSDDKTLTRFGMGVSESSLKKDWVEQKDERKDEVTPEEILDMHVRGHISHPLRRLILAAMKEYASREVLEFAKSDHGDEDDEVEPQPAPKEEGKIGYWIFKGDEINSFLVAILRQLSTEQMTVLRDALNERTPNKLRTESEVREIVGRTWEAGQQYGYYDANNANAGDIPDKETFINGLF